MAGAIGLGLEIFGIAAIAALVAAAALTCPFRWFKKGVALPYLLPLACAAAFVAGYALLPRDFAGFKPEPGQPWKWLPYAALTTAAVSAIGALNQRALIRWISVALAAAVAAWLLNPDWPVWGLEPRWSRWLLFGYLLIIGSPLAFLPSTSMSQAFTGAAVAVAALLAVVIGALVSLRMAQLAAITSAAFFGTFIGCLPQRPIAGATNRTLVATYAVLVGGVAWLACVEPDPPETAILIVPLLPLGLWLGLWLYVAFVAARRKHTPHATTTPQSAH